MFLSRRTSSLLRPIAAIFVILCVTAASLKYGRRSSRSPVRFADSFFGFTVDNDTCAYMIMEKYDCDEVMCLDKSGLFNYLYIQDCVAHGWLKILFPICWILLLTYMIYILATTADKYFCVALTDMVEKLGIPPSIAGVTFLSFGNGGPDVFALMSAVISGYTHIGMGSNLGAGLFITTVITGVVTFMSECAVNPLSFFRDIITYIISTVYLVFVFFDKKIKLWEVIGFFVIYLIYVAIVIIFRKQSAEVYEDAEMMQSYGSREILLSQNEVDELVGTTGLSVTAKVKVMSEPMYSIRHVVKEMVLDEFDDSSSDGAHPILPDRYKSTLSLSRIAQHESPARLYSTDNGLILEELEGISPVEEDESEIHTEVAINSGIPADACGSIGGALPEEEEEREAVEREAGEGGHRSTAGSLPGVDSLSEIPLETETQGTDGAELATDSMIPEIPEAAEEEEQEKEEPKKGEEDHMVHLTHDLSALHDIEEAGGFPVEREDHESETVLAPLLPDSSGPHTKWALLKASIRKEKEFFKSRNWYQKIIYIAEAPLVFLRNATIPVVMEERYNKFLLLLTAFGMPLFIFYKTDRELNEEVLGMPCWSFILIGTIFLFLLFAFFMPFEGTPNKAMFLIILFTSFFMSIMWVEEIADELVVLMNALGSMAQIQPFIMGLTVLAVGNSISDLVGDITITKQGYPQMAIGGVYASPMFSMLMGLGVALGIRIVEAPGEDITLGEDTIVINITFVFLLITLVTTLIVVPLQKFRYTKKFGIVLISLYLVSMVCNILASCGILRIPFLEPKV